jgi:hypothetical protein
MIAKHYKALRRTLMFRRYLVTVTFSIAVITGVILLTLSMKTPAYPVNQLVNLENPQEVTYRLIMKTINNYNPCLTEDQKITICQTIINESNETHFDPFLITGVIAAESSFVPNAVSPCAAQGLMQVTAGVAGMMQIKNPFDIKENIYAGTRYLQYLQRIFQDTELILAAYNAGPTRVARLGRVPRISETIDYIRKVQSFYEDIRAQFQTAMISLAIYPVCFQSEDIPASSISLPNHEAQFPSNDGMTLEPLTAYLETRRYLNLNSVRLFALE